MSLPVSNGKTVLITGINGYIASVLGQLLLTKGYSIRGTTRRSISSEPLLNGPYEPYQNRVKIYEIPDMTVDGAFDEAAKGMVLSCEDHYIGSVLKINRYPRHLPYRIPS
jgi:nucleoside-diphosphate-sugar epimerase